MRKTRRSFNSTLKPSKGPTRKTKLRVKGKSRFPHRRNDAYRKWIRSFLCVGCMGDRIWSGYPSEVAWSECAHIKTKGSGGYDIDNCVPLCRTHHREQEGRTARFDKKYEVCLERLAKDFGRRWREQQGETAA